MGDRTSRFGFTIFDDPDDQVDTENWKFGVADRHLLDRLLAYAVEAHTHDGRIVVVDPPPPPVVNPYAEDGRLPAGATTYYRYAVVDERGQEQLASDMAVYHSPTQITEPGPPWAPTVVSGSLYPGVYVYALSAFTGDTYQETLLGRPVVVNLARVGGISLNLPRPMSGVDGYNLYRKGPGDESMRFISALAGDLGAWEDSGSINPSPFRVEPTANTTNSNNAVRIALPPSYPWSIDGAMWKVYRTFDPSNWEDSLLAWDAEFAVVDTGHATRAGTPPTTSAAVGSAPRINTSDMAEVEGTLPPGVNVHLETISFSVLGQVHVGYGEWPFVCEWDRCEVVGIRAALGIGSAPAAQDVIVSLEKLVSGDTTWVECLDTYEWAYVPVGQQIGELVAVQAGVSEETLVPASFMMGDAMRLVVRQEGAGATPTDSDLMVTVLVLVQGGSTTETYTWETS